jgi:hypothetical protein
MMNGDMCPEPPDVYAKWGRIGELLWKVHLYVHSADLYSQSVKRQVADRGAVGKDAWGTQHRWQIAQRISEIVAIACWNEHLSFHPNDAWRIVGKCEIGNMSDVDAVCRIEKEFQLVSPCDELWQRVKDGLTFGDVVTYITEKGVKADRQQS